MLDWLEDELALLGGLWVQVWYMVVVAGMPMFTRKNRFKDRGVAWAAT